MFVCGVCVCVCVCVNTDDTTLTSQKCTTIKCSIHVKQYVLTIPEREGHKNQGNRGGSYKNRGCEKVQKQREELQVGRILPHTQIQLNTDGIR